MVLEALQTKVFEEKNFGLRNPIVGQLYLNRADKLIRLEMAGRALISNLDEVLPAGMMPPPILQQVDTKRMEVLVEGLPMEQLFEADGSLLTGSLLEGLRTYEQAVAAARMMLASAQHPARAADGYLLMIQVQAHLNTWLNAMFDAEPLLEQTEPTHYNADVKVREVADSAALIALAKATNLAEGTGAKEAKHWADAQRTAAPSEQIQLLFTELYRIQKVRKMERAALAKRS